MSHCPVGKAEANRANDQKFQASFQRLIDLAESQTGTRRRAVIEEMKRAVEKFGRWAYVADDIITQLEAS